MLRGREAPAWAIVSPPGDHAGGGDAGRLAADEQRRPHRGCDWWTARTSLRSGDAIRSRRVAKIRRARQAARLTRASHRLPRNALSPSSRSGTTLATGRVSSRPGRALRSRRPCVTLAHERISPSSHQGVREAIPPAYHPYSCRAVPIRWRTFRPPAAPTLRAASWGPSQGKKRPNAAIPLGRSDLGVAVSSNRRRSVRRLTRAGPEHHPHR
jgi:hypothetical protein